MRVTREVLPGVTTAVAFTPVSLFPPDVQAAVLRDDDRLGCRQLGRDFSDHRLLLLQIKTQGLPPCFVQKPATLNQEPTAFLIRVRHLRRRLLD